MNHMSQINFHSNAFIFDWYCYNEGIALDRCSCEGFLKAR